MKKLIVIPFILVLLLGVWFMKPTSVKPSPNVIPLVTSKPIPTSGSVYVPPITSSSNVNSYTGLDSNVLWSLVQNWRSSQGLQPYIKDQRLCAIAEDRVSTSPHDHTGLYQKYGNYPYVIQENIVWSYPTEQASLNGWIGSPAHHATLIAPYADSCIACLQQECIEIFSSFKTDKNNPY